MRKQILGGVLALCLLVASPVWAAEKPALGFQVNGTSAVFTEETGLPYLSESGRAMMPLRACLSAIGCKVDWNQEKQTAILDKHSLQVQVPVGEAFLYVNGRKVATDSPAALKNGRVYVPLRVVLEAFGYGVDWDNQSGTVQATELTAFNINGGTTGIFSRQQLNFDGFDGIEGDVTLPYVTIGEKGDCPYVYFGLDWANDLGNLEGGFQFIEDSSHEAYNKWTVFMRQGNSWLSGNQVYLDQGSRHHLKLYAQQGTGGQMEVVLELDGAPVIRKVSERSDFQQAGIKAVLSIAMSKVFDGSNCPSSFTGARLDNVQVSRIGEEIYRPLTDYPQYYRWNRTSGASGMWLGTVDCVPNYIHYLPDGSLSIYKGE
ncbi:hypothetical protein Ami103574_05590 [Aminipila butyrica]|uniref:Copper amine oxidase-like N-terminal domain-containing protein n=1 Tax=Aminipila butyrica TaxID=433296 RepID=A0A858BXN4_9FIRM|nr:stalk domain-containing protein [Aminipila butyrica]QIB68826.1 hypothetical protein Ami103574_05590 [Aminipila butyrica]